MENSNFIQQLKDSPRPTVVDFWAPWCVPCKRTKPVLDALAQEYAGRVDFRAVNADENPELIRELKILGIPTLLTVDAEQNLSRIMGAKSPGQYRELFDSLASGGEVKTPPLSDLDRILRLGIGGLIAIFAWANAIWWLLPIGLVIMFTGVYDRCPIWQAISARFKRSS